MTKPKYVEKDRVHDEIDLSYDSYLWRQSSKDVCGVREGYEDVGMRSIRDRSKEMGTIWSITYT
jgi:hypothetical protein